jgi:hypothetical protein
MSAGRALRHERHDDVDGKVPRNLVQLMQVLVSIVVVKVPCGRDIDRLKQKIGGEMGMRDEMGG